MTPDQGQHSRAELLLHEKASGHPLVPRAQPPLQSLHALGSLAHSPSTADGKGVCVLGVAGRGRRDTHESGHWGPPASVLHPHTEVCPQEEGPLEDSTGGSESSGGGCLIKVRPGRPWGEAEVAPRPASQGRLLCGASSFPTPLLSPFEGCWPFRSPGPQEQGAFSQQQAPTEPVCVPGRSAADPQPRGRPAFPESVAGVCDHGEQVKPSRLGGLSDAKFGPLFTCSTRPLASTSPTPQATALGPS